MKGKIEQKEKVLVIVPVYNTNQYLDACVESILNQTYSNLQLLLINDGSTDDTGKRCEDFARQDKRVIVHHKPNGGVADARNYALNIARHLDADYYLFVDHDDWIDPKHIADLYQMLKETHTDIAICNFTIFNTDKKVYLSHIQSSDFFQKVYSIPEWFENQYNSRFNLSQCFTVPWGSLYKKSLFHNIVYPVGRRVEDDYTTYKVYLNAQSISFMNQASYIHRKSNQSITQTSSVIDTFPISSIEERIAILSSRQMNIKRELDAYRYRLNLHATAYLEMGNIDKYKETLLKLQLLQN